MKKINKILLAPLPIVALMPTMVFATSCNSLDYSKAEAWFKEEFAKAKDAFNQLPETQADAALKKGLAEVGEVELAMIQGKVPFYWIQTAVNLRKERYHTDADDEGIEKQMARKFDNYFGGASDEREKIFKPLRTQMKANGTWLELAGADAYPKTLGKEISFYHMISVFNGAIANKGVKLKDVVGWGNSIIWATLDIKYGKTPKESSFKDPDLYAIADAANVSYIYEHMSTPYKSPTLALYKYYSEITTNKAKFEMFLEKTLNFDLNKRDRDTEIDTLKHRFLKNYYIVQYALEFTDLTLEKNEVQLIEAINEFISRMDLIIEG